MEAAAFPKKSKIGVPNQMEKQPAITTNGKIKLLTFSMPNKCFALLNATACLPMRRCVPGQCRKHISAISKSPDCK